MEEEVTLNVRYAHGSMFIEPSNRHGGGVGQSIESDWKVIMGLVDAEAPCSSPDWLEVLDADDWLPMGSPSYDADADLLVFGSTEGATVVLDNAPLVAYWRPTADPAFPYDLIGVGMRSARRWLGHLA